MLKKIGQNVAAAVAVSAAISVPVFAAGSTWDYSTLTSSVDYSSVATGVLAVAALLAAVYAGIKGAKIVLSFLR